MQPKTIMTLEVIGGQSELIEFLKVCGAIQWCGNVGASRDLPVSVDGDGSGQLRFRLIEPFGKGEDLPSLPEEQWKEGALSIGE